MKACLGLVSGHVQGVWFRRWVQQECVPEGLRGYAKNLPDGRVEVLLVGDERQLLAGKAIVVQGSPGSRVTGVTWSDLETVPAVDGFKTF